MKLPALYNRSTKSIEYENTYKADGLAFLYNTSIGKLLTEVIMTKKILSNAYGYMVKSKRSVANISKFIDHYKINTDEIKRPLDSFKSFNDFFIRELKEGARPVDTTPTHLISPADSRLLVFDLSRNVQLPVKGFRYKLIDLVKSQKIVDEYKDGWCFIYRLAPADYHRYCYIDDGLQEKVIRLKGKLHSVHPIALQNKEKLLAKNYRELTVLHTTNFGEVLHIEVGALFVGKIIQHHRGGKRFVRGEEKGYFEFGGSTIIQLFKKGKVVPDDDIQEYSAQKIETLIKMGEKVGVRPPYK